MKVNLRLEPSGTLRDRSAFAPADSISWTGSTPSSISPLYFLDYLLNFRDDLPGAASPRGLTAWHLNHRAGLAPQERAPRPS